MEELKVEQTIDQDSVKQLMDAITKIPSLGLYGIIAAIVLIIVMVGVWLWWHNWYNKQVQKETEQQRAKDQAGTVTDNQKIEDEAKKAQEQIDAIRKEESDQGKQDVPNKP